MRAGEKRGREEKYMSEMGRYVKEINAILLGNSPPNSCLISNLQNTLNVLFFKKSELIFCENELKKKFFIVSFFHISVKPPMLLVIYVQSWPETH